MKPTQQIYENYTHEDFLVWKILFNKQMAFLNENVSHLYLEALQNVQFTNEAIPDFQKVNTLLSQQTGWNLVVVPNICPQKEFFGFLATQKFTATCWLRTMQQLEYLEEPDMFHDVFGHIPLLSNQPYGIFLQELSRIAMKHQENELAIELLGRLYWYTIEFGLIREENKVKIYGAGLISSIGEAKHAFSDQTLKHDFDIFQMMSKPYRNDIMQNEYFVIDGFEQLYDNIPEIENCLDKMLNKNEK